MKLFGCFSGGNKSQKASEDKVVNFEQKIHELNKQLNASKEEHAEDIMTRDRELKSLEEANNEFAAKVEELTAKISVLEAENKAYKEVESSKETQSQGAGDEEIQNMIKLLEKENEMLVSALKAEKEKAKKRRKEATERRAKFKERVQYLTRKLSDDELSEDGSNTASTTGLCDTPTGNSPKR